MKQLTLRTPIKDLGLLIRYSVVDDETVIDSIDLLWKKPFKSTSTDKLSIAEKRIARALASYWSGKSGALHALPLSPQKGTAFQRQVWRAAQEIPNGATLTYGELARKIRRPKAARAVGNALNKNPWPLCVPCHRITAGHRQLGGFALGLELKKILLSHENNSSYRQ